MLGTHEGIERRKKYLPALFLSTLLFGTVHVECWLVSVLTSELDTDCHERAHVGSQKICRTHILGPRLLLLLCYLPSKTRHVVTDS